MDKITGYERAESLLAYLLQGGGGGDVRKILRRINHLIHEIRDSSSLRNRDVDKVLYQITIIVLQDERSRWKIMRIFDLHTSKARSELKVVLLHLWRVNVKTIGGFINITLADLLHINLRHNNITILFLGRP